MYPLQPALDGAPSPAYYNRQRRRTRTLSVNVGSSTNRGLERIRQYRPAPLPGLNSFATAADIGEQTDSPELNMTAQCPRYLADYSQTWESDPHQANLEWFADAAFGLFIHYGLYSQLQTNDPPGRKLGLQG